MSPRRPSAPRARSDRRAHPEPVRAPGGDADAGTPEHGPISPSSAARVLSGTGAAAPVAPVPSTGPAAPSAPSAPPGRNAAGPSRRRARRSSAPGSRRGGRQEPRRPERRSRAASTKRAARAAPQPARPAVTVRTLALGLVLLVAFIVVAPTLRAYLDQREQYRTLEADLNAVGAEVDRLERELRRWEDPGYVEAQARERLSFVRPGEMAFRVIDPETVVGEAAAEGALEGLTEAVDQAPVPPWYLTLWDSVLDAGEPVEEHGSGGAGPAGEAPVSGSAEGGAPSG